MYGLRGTEKSESFGEQTMLFQKMSWLGLGLVLLGGIVETTKADITAVGPFVGDLSENFSSFPGGTGGLTSLDIFGGEVTLFRGEGGSVKIEFSSERGGDLVVPRSSPVMLGQFGVMEWTFHTPISQFGGYFENNSRFDDIVISMYGANNQLIGTVSAHAPAAAQAWTWNGWHSDTPIHRLTTAGNDVVFLNGFVWFDDMEITFATIPEPSVGLPILLISLAAMGWNRKRSHRIL